METATSSNNHLSTYQVVARRYRPLGFDQLIGQESITRALSNAITTGRIGHAYLFTGARGVGKTSSARIFAKALNCVHGPTPTPCNVCEICLGITSGEDVDVLEIDGASNRGIDEIRLLRQNTSIRPSRARFKVYIIDEVHMLTREAFNALLKTLEEPPEHVKFIFCTTEPGKIPITILSRCQRFDFGGIDSESITARLEQIITTEGSTVESGVCEALSRRANGSMRDAQSLLEQLLSFASDHITLADVHAMLGTMDDQKLLDLIAAIFEEKTDVMLTILTNAAQAGNDYGVLVEQLMGIFRDLMITACGCSEQSLSYTSQGSFGRLKELANQFQLERILASLQVLDQTYQRMRYSTQGQILAEMALVRLSTMGHFQQISELIRELRTAQGPHKILVSRSDDSAGSEHSKKKHDSVLTRLNESPLPSSPVFQLETMTNQLAADLWRMALDSLRPGDRAQAYSCERIQFESPNEFILHFPSFQSNAFKYCEEKREVLRSELAKHFEKPIQLRLILNTAEKGAESAPAPRPVRQISRQAELLREASRNPLVERVQEIFEAELVEVRP